MFYNVELVKITKVDPPLLSYVQLIVIVYEKKILDKKNSMVFQAYYLLLIIFLVSSYLNLKNILVIVEN